MGLVCDKTVRALICTGSDALAGKLREHLLYWASGECVSLSVDTTDSVPARKDGDAELLFLDMDSTSLPEHAEADVRRTGLIVVSGDAGHVLHSYRWHPAAFLKPDFDTRRLAETLSACAQAWQQGRVCLGSPFARKPFRLPLGRIRYVEAYRHYCLLVQKNQSVRARFALGELAETLPTPPFARCHKSYLVHLGAVEKMTYTTLTLWNGGVTLPVGRAYHDALCEALDAWREEEAFHGGLRIGL